jgi:hypothetical protein
LQIRYLGAIGGKDIAETTRRVLRSIMANSVAQKMNFVGRGQKTGIQPMRLLQVVIGKHALQFVCSLFTSIEVIYLTSSLFLYNPLKLSFIPLIFHTNL